MGSKIKEIFSLSQIDAAQFFYFCKLTGHTLKVNVHDFLRGPDLTQPLPSKHTKVGQYRPPSETLLDGVSLVGRQLPVMACWLGVYYVFWRNP